MKDEARARPQLAGTHVVILGWAGSRPRQLAAVGRHYRRDGAQVITHCARTTLAMGLPDGWSKEGRAVADAIAAAAPERLIVHAFSNAGFWTYAGTLEALTPALRDRIAAVVVDSAPCSPEHVEAFHYAYYSTKAMVPVVLGALGRPPAETHPILSPAVWAFMRGYYHLSGRQIAWTERSTGAVIATGDWDHLLLYSAADRLIPPHYVESFAHRLRDAGRGVEAVRWEDSAHVRHMLTHRAAYFGAIARFLRARGFDA